MTLEQRVIRLQRRRTLRVALAGIGWILAALLLLVTLAAFLNITA